MRRKLFLLLATLAIVTGCKTANSVPPPPSFSGPGSVAFGCLDTSQTKDAQGQITQGQHFVPLSHCKLNADGTITPDYYHQVVFVVQHNPGQIAAVDVTANVVLDSSVIQPGFTLVEVGELPSAVVVPEIGEGEHLPVYVANLGTRSVQSLSATDFSYQLSPDYAPTGAGSTQALPDGPTDLVYFKDEASGNRYLFAPLPYARQIAQIPVDAEGTLGTPRYIDVTITSATIPPGVVPPTAAPEYERLCPTAQFPSSDPANPPVNARDPSATPRPPMSTAVDAQPLHAVVVDGPSGKELVVSDEALPVVHRFALAEFGAFTTAAFDVPKADTPIVTGVPTSDLVVTPLVPPTFQPDANAQPAATEKYLYAIDATDGSVLVVDFTTGSPTFGAVLPVAVGDTPSDRIPLPTPARRLAVVSTDYALDPMTGAPVGACNVMGTSPDPALAQPGYLRGVFVAIAGSDGAVRFADVYDLNATCRGGENCMDPPVAGDDRVAIRRHRVRIGALLTRAPSIVGAPNASFDAQSGSVQYDGSVSGLSDLTMVPFMNGCPGDGTAKMLTVYPDLSVASTVPTGPLVCVLDDVNDGVAASWVATYEGTIPFTQGTLGRLLDTLDGNPGMYFQDPTAVFCQRGVLGATNTATTGPPLDSTKDPEAGYEGDMVVITSALPWATQDDPACADFVTQSDGTRAFIAFPISYATNTKLTLEEPITPTVPGMNFAKIRHCFPETVTYTINTYGAFVVQASSTDLGPAFANRVIASGPAQECVVDTAQYPVVPANPDTYRNARARFGKQFINPQVAFEIGDPNPLPARDRLHGITGQLSFTVTNEAPQLKIDASRLPEAMTYGIEFQRLYVVDGQLNQMVAISVFPVQATATLR